MIDKQTIHDWIREDLPLAAKLNMTSKHVDKLLARLASREWRDMDSAPRDGTRFLFMTAESHASVGWFMGKSGTFFAADSLGPRSDGPTKWLPLPTPEGGE